MARWQETSKTPPAGKVVLDNQQTITARPGFFGGWTAQGVHAWSGPELARMLEKKHAKTGKAKTKPGGFFSDDNWKLWG